MTSSNGDIFCVTDHLCGEFTGPRWIPHTKASDAELSLICVWINGWVNNREAGDLRRHRAHYDVTVIRDFIHIACYFRHLLLFLPTSLHLQMFLVIHTGQTHNQTHASLLDIQVIHTSAGNDIGRNAGANLSSQRSEYKENVPSNPQFNTHQIPTLKCFSSRLAVVFVQSMEARSEVVNENIVGTAPTGISVINKFLAY